MKKTLYYIFAIIISICIINQYIELIDYVALKRTHPHNLPLIDTKDDFLSPKECKELKEYIQNNKLLNREWKWCDIIHFNTSENSKKMFFKNNLEKTLKAGNIFGSEGLAINMSVYIDNLETEFLPLNCNWITSNLLPKFNQTTNTLFIKMDSVKADDPITSIEIDNIPIKKWVHVILRLQNNILDVYINGTVSKRLVLQHTPKQNFQDVNVNHNNGFSGHLSDLRYFDRALNVFEINGILNSGPNLTSSSLSAFNDTGFYGYLSNMWYSTHV